MKIPARFVCIFFALAALVSTRAQAEWITLFDGASLEAWHDADGRPPKNWAIQDGVLVRTGAGGDLWTKEKFGDFVLELEFKTAGNSGIFFRTDNPKDNVQTGIEVQVHQPGQPGKQGVGAFYDLVAPRKVTARDGWNKVVLTARGPQLQVEINGEVVTEMNLDLWTEAGKNPDGSPNKFRTALKDFKRTGFIGLQDHDDPVWYRHVRVKRL